MSWAEKDLEGKPDAVVESPRMGVTGMLFDWRREVIWEATALLPKLGYFSW